MLLNYLSVKTGELQNVPSAHGTQVTSTIVSHINNSFGIAGIAPHAKVIPIKVGNGFGDLNSATVIQALTLINNKSSGLEDIDIVNMSIGAAPQGIFGINIARFFTGNNANAIGDLIKKLNHQKIIVVLGAGNFSWDSNSTNFFVEFGHKNAIVVGGIDDNLQLYINKTQFNNGKLKTGSNWGNEVHIYAPGQGMNSNGIKELDSGAPKLDPNTFEAEFDADAVWGGTSAAAPVISGIVALLKSFKKDLSRDQVVDLLQNSALNKSYTDNFTRLPPSASIIPQSDCGFFMSCGETIVNNLINLKIVDAKNALLRTFSEFPEITEPKKIEKFVGTLILPLDNSAIKLKELNTLNEYSLKYSDISGASDIINGIDLYGEDTTIISSIPQFKNIANYHNKLVAVDGKKQGSIINIHQIKRTNPPPIAPTGIQVVNPDYINGNLVLRWNEPANTDYYFVYQDNVKIGHVIGTSFFISGLSQGLNYQFEVEAVNSGGKSPKTGFLYNFSQQNPNCSNPNPHPMITRAPGINNNGVAYGGWKWRAGGIGSGDTVKVNVGTNIAGAEAIWMDKYCPVPCIAQIYWDYTINGSAVKSAVIHSQASHPSDLIIGGTTIGRLSGQPPGSPQPYYYNLNRNIQGNAFNIGKNSVTLQFLVFDLIQIPGVSPYVAGRFDVFVCP